jgi:hypothetical protein
MGEPNRPGSPEKLSGQLIHPSYIPLPFSDATNLIGSVLKTLLLLTEKPKTVLEDGPG